MSAVPAYRRAYDFAPDRVPERGGEPSPRITVVPGHRPEADTLSPAVIALARVVAVALVVLALIGFARIALSAATVTTLTESKEYTTLIDTARSEGSALEVQQSTLSNPTRIKAEANALGMAAPETTEVITLGRDVVATDAAGNLSLSNSVRIAAEG